MNYDVVKKLVAYGRSLEEPYDKHFRFTLTTNGVLLDDDIIAFANKEMDNIVLSIDGRKEVHDHMRPNKNGDGSYDLILDKFKKVAESRGQNRYYARGTFTHYNLDFVMRDSSRFRLSRLWQIRVNHMRSAKRTFR